MGGHTYDGGRSLHKNTNNQPSKQTNKHLSRFQTGPDAGRPWTRRTHTHTIWDEQQASSRSRRGDQPPSIPKRSINKQKRIRKKIKSEFHMPALSYSSSPHCSREPLGSSLQRAAHDRDHARSSTVPIRSHGGCVHAAWNRMGVSVYKITPGSKHPPPVPLS